jgi:hypothetical protein
MTKTNKAIIFSILGLASVGILSSLFLDKDLRPAIFFSALVLIIFFNLLFFLKKVPQDDGYQKNLIQAAGFGLIAISWFVTGYLNNQQSVLQKKRDLKVRMLTDAFFKLQNLNNREASESPVNAYIYYKYSENALAEIQLIGNRELVEAAKEFVDAMRKGDSFYIEPYNNLLIELRNELRTELDVPSINNLDSLNPYVLRVNRSTRVRTIDSLSSEDEINLIIRLNEEHKDLFK